MARRKACEKVPVSALIIVGDVAQWGHRFLRPEPLDKAQFRFRLTLPRTARLIVRDYGQVCLMLSGRLVPACEIQGMALKYSYTARRSPSDIFPKIGHGMI